MMPTFNDWASCRKLIDTLDSTLMSIGPGRYRVLLIDDGSTETAPPLGPSNPAGCIESVDILRLKRNLGHQRAICVALCYVHEHVPCEFIILMDSEW